MGTIIIMMVANMYRTWYKGMTNITSRSAVLAQILARVREHDKMWRDATRGWVCAPTHAVPSAVALRPGAQEAHIAALSEVQSTPAFGMPPSHVHTLSTQLPRQVGQTSAFAVVAHQGVPWLPFFVHFLNTFSNPPYANGKTHASPPVVLMPGVCAGRVSHHNVIRIITMALPLSTLRIRLQAELRLFLLEMPISW